jgi:membrane-bound metal-dependent hydrolase YbcI (DUF457 family)
MTGKTHQIIGITFGLGAYFIINEPHYGPATLASVVVFSSVGALLPDLDKASAEIWHSLPIVGHTAGKVVDPFISHRNITHSIIGTALAGFLFYYLLIHFPPYWAIEIQTVFISFIIAYISHLLADSFTVEGIPLLWPVKWMAGIPPKPFEGVRIMTGKWFENLIIFPIINIVLLFLIVSNWSTIKLILFK